MARALTPTRDRDLIDHSGKQVSFLEFCEGFGQLGLPAEVTGHVREEGAGHGGEGGQAMGGKKGQAMEERLPEDVTGRARRGTRGVGRGSGGLREGLGVNMQMQSGVPLALAR